jgi:beta-glucosidase
MTTAAFPLSSGFVWGAATAAFPTEGAAHLEGRTDSVWDAFCRVPGAVAEDHDGEVAADGYFRAAEDVALIAGLGLDAYRFSVSWPRVRPDGGAVNQAGLDHYRRLVDDLLDAGIEPWPTLYHWDLPQALEERGGWAARDTVAAFAEYAATVRDALGDRVAVWTTVHDPAAAALHGYGDGTHAPGRREPDAAAAALHHLLLAHGTAAALLRERDPGARVALTVGRVRDDLVLGPVFRGTPVPAAPVRDGDLALIGARLDVLGVHDDGSPGLADHLRRLHAELTGPAGVALAVTGTCAPYDDAVGPDGRVDDPERRASLEVSVRAMQEAVAAGADVCGFFVWSLLDGFEWTWGYTRRLGIVHVDFTTQTRTVKASGEWYARVAAQGGLPREERSSG